MSGRKHVPGTIQHLSTDLPAVAASVVYMRQHAAALATEAGGNDEQVDRIRLAVSEAVTNVVEHAYPRGQHGRVQVEAAVDAGELLVLVSDEGAGMSSDRVSRGLGLGLALMAEVCDGLTISARSSGGVDVQMRFVLDGAMAAAANGRHADHALGSVASALMSAVPSFSTTT